MSHTYGESVIDFGTGDRVELHPAMDRWMMGDRFGTVLRPRQYHNTTTVRVQLDVSGKIINVTPDNLRIVDHAFGGRTL